MKPYVYVLVREDISLEQKLVQVGHAVLEAGFRFQQPAQTASLIVLSVPDRGALEAAAVRLNAKGIDHYLFHEPEPGFNIPTCSIAPLL
jgi:hypothetical protein